MAEVINSGQAGGPGPDSDVVLFHRRIEFHAARKPFSGFEKNSSNGFKLVTLNPNPEPHKVSGSGKKCEKSSEFSETGLDPELSFEITFRRIGAGLHNLGNTCFLNSVLQCLTYTEPLAAYLQSGKHQNSCCTSGFCALCAIQKHVNRALHATGRSLEPKDLVSNLRCISRNFRNARQEDAHEYMVNLLESMHKCCLPSGVPSESPVAYDKSLVHKIFGGRLRSQVKCMQCSYCSDKFDPFLDLSLEIVRGDSVLKALGHFTAKEQLDGGAKQYHCQQCKQKVKALKQLTIHKAPRVLTVHLKRFSSHTPGQKIDKKISFGPRLDLKPFVTGPYDGDLNYTLYGVLVHAGWSTRSGHYYCFVRTSSGMWYSLDDNQVFQVNERRVLEQKAYMLFYVRDRKTVATKRTVNAIPKENMVMNAIGNAAYSNLDLELKEKIQNGRVEKKIDGSSSSSSTLSERDPQKGTPRKEIHSQNKNCTISVDNVGHKAIKNSDTVVYKEGSHLSGAETLNASDAEKNISGNNSFLGIVEDRNASGVKLFGCMIPQDTWNNEITPMEVVAEASNKDNILKPSHQNVIEECQVGGSSVTTGNPAIEGINESGLKPGLLSGPPATKQHSSSRRLKKKGPELKVKRDRFKYRVATTSFSYNIIFGVRSCMRRKMLKRRKNPKKSRNLKNVSSGNFSPSDLGPSVCEKSSPSLNRSRSGKKKAKCGSDDKNQNLTEQKKVNGEGDITSENIKNESLDGVIDGTTLSAEKQPQKSRSVVQGSDSVDNKIEVRQTDVINILTRGLDETTVPRWDGINVSRSRKFETRNAGTAEIGYVVDEWEEEYDRGKRKKLRTSKISFDGPNLFQEVATENSNRKRSKLNRVENQPFRI